MSRREFFNYDMLVRYIRRPQSEFMMTVSPPLPVPYGVTSSSRRISPPLTPSHFPTFHY